MISGPGFIIFSLARSGSTTLARILECHPQIRYLHEPFNSDRDHGRIRIERPCDKPSFDAVMLEIWSEYNLIKHVWNYSLHVPPAERFLDKQILLCGAKVIFLARRNRLRRVVSVEMSEQTRQWTSTPRSREHNLSFTFAALDLDSVRWEVEAESAAVAQHRSMMTDSGVEFIDWWYEDLFGDQKTSDERFGKLAEMFSFLGLPMLDRTGCSQAQSLLDPLNSKVNSADTYRRIPNIMAIERGLGSDETGWLFK